jgi:hypothetical protein
LLTRRQHQLEGEPRPPLLTGFDVLTIWKLFHLVLSVCVVAILTMNSGDPLHTNPFEDPSIGEDHGYIVDSSTLSVGRNASLTLGTDSLIVLGKTDRLWWLPGFY